MKQGALLSIIGGTATLVGGSVLLLTWSFQPQSSPNLAISLPQPTSTPTALVSTPSVSPIAEVSNSVPFTAQAPLAQWQDPVFQDACEEASVLMAMAWVGVTETISPEQATAEIMALADWQQELDGEFRDRSSFDTAEMIKQYFDYQHVVWRENVALDDIIAAVTTGNIVIVPANGQALSNPHFTSPGPERHMLVVTGYDPHTQEFVTNDPGTRFGEGFRYNQTVLYEAIRDYATGYHVPINTIDKNMIVIAPVPV